MMLRRGRRNFLSFSGRLGLQSLAACLAALALLMPKLSTMVFCQCILLGLHERAQTLIQKQCHDGRHGHSLVSTSAS